MNINISDWNGILYSFIYEVQGLGKKNQEAREEARCCGSQESTERFKACYWDEENEGIERIEIEKTWKGHGGNEARAREKIGET